ncbi:MAG: hypothetical protein HFH08_03925 [Bacilli bacterium]|nr:hypothetical protein [Bacilli bacterium]
MKKMKSLLSITLAGYMILNPFSVYALTKNETVYTSLDENGKLVLSTVTNQILNDSMGELEDETELKNILNINGKETFTLEKNTLKWKANGRDIFYRGDTTKEQPIDVRIEYYLDGQKMSPKEMIGKKGNVKLVLHYQNKLSEQVNINGKVATIYTPFVVTTGMILNNDNNKNIVVENGKTMNSGSRTMVIGLSAPGVYQSLGIKELESLDTVTITYDTTAFSLGNVYMVATPKLLEEKDLEIFDKLNSLSSNLDTLKSSMDGLEEGAKKLEEGSASLSLGASEIHTNLKTVTDSITKLKNGSTTLKDGLENIVTTLDQTIILIEQELQVSNLSEAKGQLERLKLGNETIITNTLAKLGMDYNTLMSYSGADTSVLEAKELVYVLSVNKKVVEQSISTLDLLPLLKGGLEQLKAGSIEIEYNLGLLEKGTKQLEIGAETLASGATELKDGIVTLSNGTKAMNKEGITPLHRYSNLIRNYSTKLEAMKNLSKEYHGYASNNADTTTFIYMIKGIR